VAVQGVACKYRLRITIVYIAIISRRELVEREGLSSLATGLTPRLIKGVASGAVSFTIYELSQTLTRSFDVLFSQ
jgi:hypothetical protein